MRANRDFAKERLRCYSVCFMKKSNEVRNEKIYFQKRCKKKDLAV